MIDMELHTRRGREKFIKSAESGIYGGTTDTGEKVYVFLEQGVGMDIKIIKDGKENWFEVTEYDEEGCLVSLTYEPVEEG